MEVRIEELLLVVVGMVVAPFGVGLPDFQHRIGDRRAVAIDDAALDGHALAAGLLAHEIFCARLDKRRPKERPDRLRGGLARAHRGCSSGVAGVA